MIQYILYVEGPIEKDRFEFYEHIHLTVYCRYCSKVQRTAMLLVEILVVLVVF